MGRFYQELNRNFANREMHACHVSLEMEMAGHQLLIVSRDQMLRTASLMYGEEEYTSVRMEVVSAIREVMNILAVSFTNAIHIIAGVRVLPSPPEHTADYRTFFEKEMPKGENDDGNVLLIETEFQANEKESLLYFYILPKQQDFWKLTSRR